MKRFLWLCLFLCGLYLNADKVLLDTQKEFFIQTRDFKDFTFPAAPAGKQIVVEFRHRIDTPDLGGWAPCWQLEVNGDRLTPMGTRTIPRLLNKPLTLKHKDYGTALTSKNDRWYSLYMPDYHAADSRFSPATKEASRVEVDISDAVYTDRENLVRIRFGRVAPPLAVRDLKITARDNPSKLPAKKDDKTPYIRMTRLPLPDFKLVEDKDTLNVHLKDEVIPIRSRFSIPEGKYVTMSGRKLDTKYYTVSRKIEVKENRIDVYDTFTSRFKELIGLKMQYETAGDKFSPIWVAGDKSPQEISFQGGRNPSVFGGLEAKNIGIGLIANDDILRGQNVARCENGFFGIGSDTFALSPGESRTVEWSVYPVMSADYFDFINTVRKVWNVNFPIPGGWCLGMNTYSTYTKEAVKSIQRNFALTRRSIPIHAWRHLGGKYAKYRGCINGIGYNAPAVRAVKPDGKIVLESPAPFHKFNDFILARCKEFTPDIERFIYFHNQISVQADDEKYDDCRVIKSNGQKGYYGTPNSKIFVPTHENQLGKDIIDTIDWIVARHDIDGIYLDESNYCGYTATYNEKMWDGCTVELDENFKVKRKFSFVPLLKLKFTLQFFDRIMNHHKKLFMANSAPETRSEMRFKIPRFEETASSRWIVLSHLFTPIQLGDMLTFRNTPRDMATDQRVALTRGALYYHYNGGTGCPSLTSKMWPFTPIELHSGYLIGEERILTVYSGEYGWYGTGKLAQLHVFNELGREVADYPAEVISTSAGVMTKLMLQKDYSAALVKIPVSVQMDKGVILKNIRWQNNVFTCSAYGNGRAVFAVNGKKHNISINGKQAIKL